CDKKEDCCKCLGLEKKKPYVYSLPELLFVPSNRCCFFSNTLKYIHKVHANERSSFTIPSHLTALSPTSESTPPPVFQAISSTLVQMESSTTSIRRNIRSASSLTITMNGSWIKVAFL